MGDKSPSLRVKLHHGEADRDAEECWTVELCDGEVTLIQETGYNEQHARRKVDSLRSSLGLNKVFVARWKVGTGAEKQLGGITAADMLGAMAQVMQHFERVKTVQLPVHTVVITEIGAAAPEESGRGNVAR